MVNSPTSAVPYGLNHPIASSVFPYPSAVPVFYRAKLKGQSPTYPPITTTAITA